MIRISGERTLVKGLVRKGVVMLEQRGVEEKRLGGTWDTSIYPIRTLN